MANWGHEPRGIFRTATVLFSIIIIIIIHLFFKQETKTNVNMKKLHAFTHFWTVMLVTWQRGVHWKRLRASFLRLSVSFGENDAHPNICEAAAQPRASSCPAAVKFCLWVFSRDVSSKENKKKRRRNTTARHQRDSLEEDPRWRLQSALWLQPSAEHIGPNQLRCSSEAAAQGVERQVWAGNG